jgi:hypothetical protein
MLVAGVPSLTRQEQIWNKTDSIVPKLTPSIWYDWAKDPNLLGQFHKAIMESKKIFNVLALSMCKPVKFCLWYYYHKYKNPSNEAMYKSLKKIMLEERVKQNSNECAICNRGGEILCCDTCPCSVRCKKEISGVFTLLRCRPRNSMICFISLAISLSVSLVLSGIIPLGYRGCRKLELSDLQRKLESPAQP